MSTRRTLFFDFTVLLLLAVDAVFRDHDRWQAIFSIVGFIGVTLSLLLVLRRRMRRKDKLN